MNLSKFLIELLELSGMSREAFCQKLGISNEQFKQIEDGSPEAVSGIKLLLKAVAASVFSKHSKTDDIDNRLTQAQAIVVTVAESEHLAPHHQTSLSVACELIEDAQSKF